MGTVVIRDSVDNEGDETLEYTTEEESCDMVHCDWGWGGNFNGYFVSGVFDLGNSDTVFDDYTDKGSSNYNYKRFLHIIKYNR